MNSVGFLFNNASSLWSAGKESACNAGALGWTPGLGRSLEKGEAAHSRLQAWRIPWAV